MYPNRIHPAPHAKFVAASGRVLYIKRVVTTSAQRTLHTLSDTAIEMYSFISCMTVSSSDG